MTNTVEYKGEICPFRYVGNDLYVFYKKNWVWVHLGEIKAV